MGKKTRPGKAAKELPLDEETEKQLIEIKKKGDSHFGAQKFDKAVEQYEKAIKLLPEAHGEKALYYSNKAACYIQQKKFKEAVKECNSALEIDTAYPQALKRRAAAYENQGLFKNALADVQTLIKNAEEETPDDLKRTEKRLKDIMAGRRPQAANGLGSRSLLQQRSAGGAGGQGLNLGLHFTCKVHYDNDSRIIQITDQIIYSDLVQIIRDRFPGLDHFLIRYVDKDGDLVTMTSKYDIQQAIGIVVTQFSRQLNNQGPKLNNRLPHIKLTLQKVAKEDMPAPPPEEVRERRQLQQREQGQEQQNADIIEVEDWVVDFAQVFRDMLHLDTDRRPDLQNLGWEKIQQAMDQAIKSDKAAPLWDQAIVRFQEMTAAGLMNWGMVYQYKMQKKLDEYIVKGGSKEIVAHTDELFEEIKLSEKMFDQALSYKADHFDTLLSVAQLYSTKAKILLGFYLPLSNRDEQEGEKKADEEGDDKPKIEEVQDEEQKAEDGSKKAEEETKPEAKEGVQEKVETAEASSSSQKAAENGVEEQQQKETDRAKHRKQITEIVKGLSAEKVQEVQHLFDKAHELFQKALDAATAQDKDPVKYFLVPRQEPGAEKEEGQQQAQAYQAPEDAVQEEPPRSSVLMTWGNSLFEESLIYAGVDQDWKSPLLDAIGKFREGGAREEDIKSALEIHLMKDDFELPAPPIKDTPVKAAAEEAADDNIKGLPALPRKPKETS